MNFLFIALILVSIALAFVAAASGGGEGLTQVSVAMFDGASLAVDVSLGLIGVLSLWSGFFRLAERSGLSERVAAAVAPLLTRLMPELPRQHPAHGPMVMNLSANMLGLDNAATPLGLKAMEKLQADNPAPAVARDSQIMFLVLNTSSVTLIPVTVFLYRAQQGAADPALVYLPMLLATTVSTFTGVWLAARIQGIRLLQPLILAVVAAWLLLLFTLSWLATGPLGAGLSSALGNGLLLAVVAGFLISAWRAGVPVYEQFVDGAREGFELAVRLIPYLVAMLVAIAMFRASGALDLLLEGIRTAVLMAGLDARFVDALPVGLMKPLSGSGARAMMIDVMQTHGVDSLPGRMAAVMQGSTETTFYVLAVYFGSAGVVRFRHALACGLAADGAGLVAAILASYYFFG